MQRYDYKACRDMALNDAVEGFYLMKSPSAKTTQNGKSYLSFKLADASGEMEAIFWDYAGDLHVTSAGKPVKVRGNVTEYNGKKQFAITQIRAAREDDRIDYSFLIPSAPVDPQQTYAQMFSMIESIQDPDYKGLCVELLTRYRELLCSIPAAKSVHHAFRHGLLMHTTFMMGHADYLSRVYSFVNRDLLIAGAFCHDIGKAMEYDFTPMGLVSDVSVKGQLLGHLYMGALEIAEIAKQIGMNEEKSMLLQHMLLSHHGKPEFGAAVMPKTAEALLLSMIDDMDAKMELFREAIDGKEPGMTDNVWALGYKVYNHA